MRSMLGAASIVLLALALVSCDTTQPLTLDQQTFELQMTAFGAQTGIFDVYDGYEDSDLDGQPDDTNDDGQPDFFLHCLNRTFAPFAGNPTSVPWGFTIVITILRAGEITPEQITSTAAATGPELSVSEYDTTLVIPGGVPAAPAPITIGTRTFRFMNGRILSVANRDVMAATTSPLVELDPATYGTKGSGRCSTFDPGPTLIDSATSSVYPRPITLRKGDTLTVEAFVSPDPTPGLTVTNPPAPGLSAQLKLGGSAVVVRGEIAEPTPGSGLRFSYTSR